MKKNTFVAFGLIVSQFSSMVSFANVSTYRFQDSARFQQITLEDIRELRATLENADEVTIDGREPTYALKDPKFFGLIAAATAAGIMTAKLTKKSAAAKKEFIPVEERFQAVSRAEGKAIRNHSDAIDHQKQLEERAHNYKTAFEKENAEIARLEARLAEIDSPTFAYSKEERSRLGYESVDHLVRISRAEKMFGSYLDMLSKRGARDDLTPERRLHTWKEAESISLKLETLAREKSAYSYIIAHTFKWSSYRLVLGSSDLVSDLRPIPTEQEYASVIDDLYKKYPNGSSVPPSAFEVGKPLDARFDAIARPLIKKMLEQQLAHSKQGLTDLSKMVTQNEENLRLAKEESTRSSLEKKQRGEEFQKALPEYDEAKQKTRLTRIARNNKAVTGVLALSVITAAGLIAHEIHDYKTHEIVITKDEKQTVLDLLNRAESQLAE